MAMTQWINATTGRRLDGVELAGLRRHARKVYEANTHIFEDELDALTALGVVPAMRLAAAAA
jgi:hypothetical protein